MVPCKGQGALRVRPPTWEKMRREAEKAGRKAGQLCEDPIRIEVGVGGFEAVGRG